MPRTKNKDGVNLWPAAGLTLVVFFLLIATGLVITFGVIQQLSYIAWERSLQQTERSLAAEKELVRHTNELKQLLDQLAQTPLAISEEEINNLAKQRYTLITQSLPDHPDSVAEALTDWSAYRLPLGSDAYLEQYRVETFTVIERLTQKNDRQLYIIKTMDNQTFDLYSPQNLANYKQVTAALYFIDNIAFQL